MSSPLADRLRPKTIDEVVGQKHLLGENASLRRIIESGNIPNLIFYGPSGVGKTTVARIIASQTNKRLHKLNGTNASLADIKAIVGELDTIIGYNGILLYLDEIQYLNKKQQQSLLEYIEDGRITLIASTTENPYFYIYNAILSRSTVFEFKSVPWEEVEKAVTRGFASHFGRIGLYNRTGRRRFCPHCQKLRRGCTKIPEHSGIALHLGGAQGGRKPVCLDGAGPGAIPEKFHEIRPGRRRTLRYRLRFPEIHAGLRSGRRHPLSGAAAGSRRPGERL